MYGNGKRGGRENNEMKRIYRRASLTLAYSYQISKAQVAAAIAYDGSGGGVA